MTEWRLNALDIGDRNGIEISDIRCGELDEKDVTRLVKLINKYRAFP